MSFSFNFEDDIDDSELDAETAAYFAPASKPEANREAANTQEPFIEVPISTLVSLFDILSENLLPTMTQ